MPESDDTCNVLSGKQLLSCLVGIRDAIQKAVDSGEADQVVLDRAKKLLAECDRLIRTADGQIKKIQPLVGEAHRKGADSMSSKRLNRLRMYLKKIKVNIDSVDTMLEEVKQITGVTSEQVATESERLTELRYNAIMSAIPLSPSQRPPTKP